jgi:hypothetical protein
LRKQRESGNKNSFQYFILKRRAAAHGPTEYADWIQVQRLAAIRRTDRFEHVRDSNYYFLAPEGKLL